MTNDNQDDLAKLREVAEGATPGEWWADFVEVRYDDGHHCPDSDPGSVLVASHVDDEDQGERNATHIATFDPPTVLRLLDRLEHHRETLRLAVSIDADCDLDMDVLLKREPWLFKKETDDA